MNLLILAGVALFFLTGSKRSMNAQEHTSGIRTWTKHGHGLPVALRLGHSRQAPGATEDGITEHEYARGVAERLAVLLPNPVLITDRRTRAQFRRESEIVDAFCGKDGLDIQLHLNHSASPKPKGTLTMFYKGSRRGERLATLISRETQARLGEGTTYNPQGTVGLNAEGFGRIRYMMGQTRGPSVITESWFLSNPESRERLGGRAAQNSIADAIAAAVKQYEHPGKKV